MPKTTAQGEPRKSEIPQTLERSDEEAQRTWAKTYDSAMDEYDDEERAARTAWASLKHTHEKVGDRWQPKKDSGPSDSRAAHSRRTGGDTAGGVNANASKDELYSQAQDLGIEGRSSMTKDELVDALKKESDRRTKKNAG